MSMNVDLTADQKAFIHEAIESGRFQSAEDAVREVLSLWEEGERRRAEILATVDAAFDLVSELPHRLLRNSAPLTSARMQLQQRGRLRLMTDQESPR